MPASPGHAEWPACPAPCPAGPGQRGLHCHGVPRGGCQRLRYLEGDPLPGGSHLLWHHPVPRGLVRTPTRPLPLWAQAGAVLTAPCVRPSVPGPSGISRTRLALMGRVRLCLGPLAGCWPLLLTPGCSSHPSSDCLSSHLPPLHIPFHTLHPNVLSSTPDPFVLPPESFP